MTAPIRTRRGCSPLALLGCGCGFLAGLGILLIFFLLSVQVMHARRDPIAWNRQSYAQCQQNLSYLRTALANYYSDHQQYPEKLEDLSPRYVDSALRLRCPLEMQEHGRRYQYEPNAANPADPVVTCRNHPQGTLVLQRNGRLRLPNFFHK